MNPITTTIVYIEKDIGLNKTLTLIKDTLLGIYGPFDINDEDEFTEKLRYMTLSDKVETTLGTIAARDGRLIATIKILQYTPTPFAMKPMPQ